MEKTIDISCFGSYRMVKSRNLNEALWRLKTVRNFCVISCTAIVVGTGMESLRRKQTKNGGFNRLNVGAISNSEQQGEGASASVQCSCIFRVSVQYSLQSPFFYFQSRGKLGRVQNVEVGEWEGATVSIGPCQTMWGRNAWHRPKNSCVHHIMSDFFFLCALLLPIKGLHCRLKML